MTRVRTPKPVSSNHNSFSHSSFDSLLKEFWIKRLSQSSTVAVFKTSDPKRLEPFLRFIKSSYDKLVGKQTISSYEVFLYRVWSGLFKASVVADRVAYEPVSLRVQSQLPAPLQLTSSQQHVRDLATALSFIDNLMNQRDGIVFVLWGLFPKKGSPQEQDALIAFLRNAIFTDSYYSKFHTIVVFTDTPEALIDDDTLKHSILIDVPPSYDSERRRIIENVAKTFGLSDNFDALVEATRGLNLHETESVVLESFFKYRKLEAKVMTAYKYDIIRKSGILDIEEPRHGFEAVGGYDIVKEFINVNVIKILRNPRKAERLGLRPPRGILLFGPPGTGKTLFARSLAKELGLPFLRLRTEKIVSKWYGETSRNIAKAIEIAEAVAPCVLFIDEIDRFGRRGHLGEHEESRRAFSILLEWLGDARRKTIVIGTTNRPEDLDEAFRRVGRFDYLIPFLYPDYQARLEILKVHTKVVRKVPLAKDVDLRIIASRTELWTGAELEELVLRAARRALREDVDVVRMKHFEEALETFRINYEQRRQQLEHYLRLAEEYTNDAEFLEKLRRSEKSRLETVKSLVEG